MKRELVIVLLCAGGVFDAIATRIALNAGAREANFLLTRAGAFWPVVKVFLTGLCILGLFIDERVWPLSMILAAGFFALGFWNLRNARILRKRGQR